MAEVQDLVAIGGGSGGYAAAMRAAQLGAKVTVVEQAQYGGNCVNKACIPSKYLMTVARLMGAIRQAPQFGIRVGQPRPDMDAIHNRKDRIIEGLRLSTESLLAGRGVTLVQGRGKLVAPNVVEVAGKRIQAHNIVIATGSSPAQMPIAGIDLPGVIGTEEAIELREIPARLAILGSKPWDLELAQFFHLMGSQVTLIESGSQLLPEADREIAQRLGKLLYDAGIAIRRGVSVNAIHQEGDGSLIVELADGKGQVIADKVLAARRLPSSTGLGLRELGIAIERGAVRVDERLQANVPHVYAVGDVAAAPTGAVTAMWSHKAHAEGIVAAENAMALDSKLDYAALPHGLYAWPQVAWVGLSEDQAVAKGIEFRVGRAPMIINPYAAILDQATGAIKIVVGKYDKILGAHILAPGAVDLINAIAVAMLSEATLRELTRLVPLHPAIGEALVDAAMDVEGRPLHLLP